MASIVSGIENAWSQAFDCSSFGVGSDSFLPFDGFNSENVFPSLADVNSSYDTVNFDEYENITNSTTILSFDLMELKDNLTALQMIFNTTVGHNSYVSCCHNFCISHTERHRRFHTYYTHSK